MARPGPEKTNVEKIAKQNPDTQRRILDAALSCVKRWGIEKVTLNDIAQEAGVTRPTVYSYFGSRDEVVRYALMESGLTFSTELLKHVSKFTNPAERIIEAMLYSLKRLPKEPVLALLQENSLVGFLNNYALTVPESNDIRTMLFASILADANLPPEEMDEITEVATRFLLSLLTMQGGKKRSEKELRGFLERRLLPALGMKK